MNNKKTKSLDEIRIFYNSVYYKSIKDRLTTTPHLRKLARKINIKKEQQILDVACGVGEWLLACEELGANTNGVDLSEKAILFCKNSLKEGDFLVTEAETLKFNENRFDVVSCLGSLEHFINPIKSLKEMIRVAKKDAKFLLLVPNSGFLTRRLGLFTGTYQVDAKEHVRSLLEWKEMFEESGLVIDNMWKDLHVLSWSWISLGNWYTIPFRAIQALTLTIWPLKWQYQVYYLCSIKNK